METGTRKPSQRIPTSIVHRPLALPTINPLTPRSQRGNWRRWVGYMSQGEERLPLLASRSRSRSRTRINKFPSYDLLSLPTRPFILRYSTCSERAQLPLVQRYDHLLTSYLIAILECLPLSNQAAFYLNIALWWNRPSHSLRPCYLPLAFETCLPWSYA